MAIAVGISNTLIENGIRQVVYQHLHADVVGTFVAFLLRRGVFLFPFALTVAVGLVAVHHVFENYLYRLPYATLAYRHLRRQHRHKRRLVLHAVPVTHLYTVNIYRQRREHRLAHRRTVYLRHICREEVQRIRQRLRHLRRFGIFSIEIQLSAAALLLRVEHAQHLLQLVVDALARLVEGVLQRPHIFILGEVVVAWNQLFQPVERVVADAAQRLRQLERKGVAVALTRLLAVVVLHPELPDYLRIRNVVIRLAIVMLRRRRACGSSVYIVGRWCIASHRCLAFCCLSGLVVMVLINFFVVAILSNLCGRRFRYAFLI